MSGNQISARLDGFSFFFLIPAGVGLFAYLRERKPALAMTGGGISRLLNCCDSFKPRR